MSEAERAAFNGQATAIILFAACIFMWGILAVSGLRWVPDNDIILTPPNGTITVGEGVSLVNYPRSSLPFERGIRIETEAWVIRVSGVNYVCGRLELTTELDYVVAQLDYYRFNYEISK